MIINNLKNLLEERDLTSYALAKKANLSPNNVKEIVDNELVVPRAKAIQGICKSLQVNVDDVLKFVPHRVNTRSNKTMNRSRLSQNYMSNEQYNILDVQRRHEEMQEQMLIY